MNIDLYSISKESLIASLLIPFHPHFPSTLGAIQSGTPTDDESTFNQEMPQNRRTSRLACGQSPDHDDATSGLQKEASKAEVEDLEIERDV